MAIDGWKDGISRDDVREHAEYMAALCKTYMDEFQKVGFGREEALRLMIVIIPVGLNPDHK